MNERGLFFPWKHEKRRCNYFEHALKILENGQDTQFVKKTNKGKWMESRAEVGTKRGGEMQEEEIEGASIALERAKIE